MASKVYKHEARAGDAWLVPGDLHCPLEDRESVRAMRQWFDERAELWLRRGVIWQGDNLDCFGLSRFGKSAKKYWSAGKLMTGVESFRPLAEWSSEMELGGLMNLGNHELWIRKFLDESPALEGCPGLEFGSLTGLDDIDNLEILDYDTRILLGENVLAMHGHGSGCKTALGLLQKYPYQTTVQGHYHRIQSAFRTYYKPDGTASYRGGHLVGHLASDEALEDYAPDADMQRGFAVIEFFGPQSKPYHRVSTHLVLKDKRGQAYVA